VTAASSSPSRASLEALAAQFGPPLQAAATSRLLAFMELLLRWNARINLTGARTEEELLADHLPDAFALAQLAPAGADVVDVGSGGGLPAIPLAVLRPDLRLTLVEPRAKRVAFLRAATRELATPAEVVAGRVETLGRRFGVAMSRATFSPTEWLEKAVTVTSAGGRIVLLLSGRGEIPAGAPVVETVVYRAGHKDRVAVAVQA
jgi:16S rRNA (guanine527-N7)-methyltransferase